MGGGCGPALGNGRPNFSSSKNLNLVRFPRNELMMAISSADIRNCNNYEKEFQIFYQPISDNP